MDNLQPTCRWREDELSPERYRCASRKLIVSPAGVTLDICSKCYYANHEPDPEDAPQQAIQISVPQQEPSLAQRLASFAHAMQVELAWRAQGGAAPTDEEKAARRAHCDANQCGQHDESNDSCKACGCYLTSRIIPPIPLGKLDCATQRCPVGLWEYTSGYTPPAGLGCGGCSKKSSES